LFTLKSSVFAGSLALLMPMMIVGVQARSQAGHDTVAPRNELAQENIPDAPKPQPSLPGLGSVAPGKGTSASTSTSNTDTQPDEGPSAPAPAANVPGPATPSSGAQSVYIPPTGQGEDAIKTLMVHVDAVDIPFTVKDSKGKLVPGLEPRDIQIYENGLLQHIQLFTNDAIPLSVAIVIDQSMSHEDMDRVNASLGTLQSAFAPFDEVAVFTYNKIPRLVTTFTGAQSMRLTQAIESAKSSGRDEILAGSLGGPMSQTTVINDQNFDPNTSAIRNHTGMQLSAPREVHPLNDAILAAATALSNRPIGRRRVIYVISNGNEYGSEVKTAQVKKYLLTNGIEVDGSLVGDTALMGMGVLDRVHLPLMMRDNVLPVYAVATGGNFDAEFRPASIEKSFARIANEVRSRYTVGYTTHEPFLDGKYRKLEIKVLLPNLTVIAPPGYWPRAMEMRPQPAPTPASSMQ
jgi:VWFA-related protein